MPVANYIDPDAKGELSFEFIVQHGDSGCPDAPGGESRVYADGHPPTGDGVACQIRLFPPGFALYVVPRAARLSGASLMLSAETNDVRVASSPPMRHWLVAGLRVDRGATAAFAKQNGAAGGHARPSALVGLPRPVYFSPENRARVWGPLGWARPGPAGTDLLPGEYPTALWDAAVVTRGFRLLWSYFHMHSPWVSEYRVFYNATPATLGLDSVGTAGVLIEDAQSIATVQSLVDAPPVAPTCVWSRADEPRDTIPGTANDGGDAFYRRVGGACTHSFRAPRGTPLVFVLLFAPDSSAAARPLWTGHQATRLFVEYDEEPEEPFVSVTPSPTSGTGPDTRFGFKYIESPGGERRPWMPTKEDLTYPAIPYLVNFTQAKGAGVVLGG